jgi:hypothetical protein
LSEVFFSPPTTTAPVPATSDSSTVEAEPESGEPDLPPARSLINPNPSLDASSFVNRNANAIAATAVAGMSHQRLPLAP